MTDMQLGYLVAKIGCKNFKKGYPVFEEYMINHDRNASIEQLIQLGISQKSVNAVFGNAKAVFQSGRQVDALAFVRSKIG